MTTADRPGQTATVAAKIDKVDNATVARTFDDGGDLGVELRDCSLS